MHVLSTNNERSLCIKGWKKLQSCARNKMYLTLWTMPMVCSHQSACISFSRYILTWHEGDCLSCPDEGLLSVGGGGKRGWESQERNLIKKEVINIGGNTMGFEVLVLCIIMLFQKISLPLPWKLFWFKLTPFHPTPLEIPQSLTPTCWYTWP